MNEHPQYIIRTISDFWAIPSEKIAHALQDFANWIDFVTSDEVQKALKGTPGLELCLSQFIWIDDGKHDIIPVVTLKKPAKDQGDE